MPDENTETETYEANEQGIAYSSESASSADAPAKPATIAPAAATGRRKEAVARVRIVPGSGQWKINNSNGVNLYYGNNPWTPLYRTWYFGSHAKSESEEIHRFPDYEKVVRTILDLPRTERGEAFQKQAVDHILHRPDLFLLRSVNRMRCFWGFDIFTAAHLREARPSVRRWFPVVLALDAACYLAVAGFAFFWIAAAPAAFWRRWETWLFAGAILFYALPYWVSMSHPTYHFPVMAPLALLGVLAYQVVRSSGAGNRARGWAALAVLMSIQLEWVFFLTQA